MYVPPIDSQQLQPTSEIELPVLERVQERVCRAYLYQIHGIAAVAQRMLTCPRYQLHGELHRECEFH